MPCSPPVFVTVTPTVAGSPGFTVSGVNVRLLVVKAAGVADSFDVDAAEGGVMVAGAQATKASDPPIINPTIMFLVTRILIPPS